MRSTKAQGREARGGIEEGGGGVKKLKKTQKMYRRYVENGGDSGGRRENVDKRVLLQKMSTQNI